MSKILKDCVAKWPPRNGAAVEHAPEVDASDVIINARVSNDGHLVLRLESAGQRFTASTKIFGSSGDQLRKVISDLPGKSITQASALTFDPHG